MRNHCELKKKIKNHIKFHQVFWQKIVINKQYHNYKRKNIYIFTFEIFNLNIQTFHAPRQMIKKKVACTSRIAK